MPMLLPSPILATLLGLALVVPGCSKNKATTAPASATPVASESAAPAPQGIAVGEPHPATPAADGRPVSVTDADVAMAEKMFDVMAKLSAGVVSAGSDCKQAATEIRTVGAEVKQVSLEGKKLEDKFKSDAAAKEWLEKTYAPKLSDTMGKMMASACINDPAVREAMGALRN
jgi:hypothetical protein